MSTTRWSSFAVSTRSEWGGLLLDCLGTAADDAVSSNLISGWSFHRTGSQLTLSVRDLVPEGVGFLTAAVPGELTLQPVPYRAPGPEYGVPEQAEPPQRDELADAAEELSCAASQVALAVLRAASTGRSRRGAGFALLVTSARAVCAHTGEEVELLRSQPCRHDLARTAREQAEVELTRGRARYEKILAGARRTVDSGEAVDNYLGFWAQQLRQYLGRLSTSGCGLLSGQDVRDAVLAHVRSLCGQIGLDPGEVATLSWLASLVVAGAAPGAGFHDLGMDTPARRYHERSKFFGHTMASQLPRTEALPGKRGGSAEPLLALPPADPGLLTHPGLVDCLRQRRSHRGDYGGALSVDALATLLWLSMRAREEPAEPPDADGHQPLRRSYPSPGSWFPGRVLLYPPGVAELDSAIYEYRPEQHRLRVVHSAVDHELLLTSSPYLIPELPLSVRGDTVPVWLFLLSDIDDLSRRYGLRAYRFLLMEIGHLAQNIVLTATGMGLRSLTIGSFYDDLLSQFIGVDGTNTAPFYLLPIGAAG